MLLNAKNETNTGTVMRLEPTEIDGIYKISMSTDLTKYTIRLSDDEIDKVRYHLEELYYFCDLLHYSKTLYIRTHDPKYPDKDDIKEFTDIHNIILLPFVFDFGVCMGMFCISRPLSMIVNSGEFIISLLSAS